MKMIITQLRKTSANPELPQFLNNAYPVNEHADEYFPAADGYEIAGVYLMPDNAVYVTPETDASAL